MNVLSLFDGLSCGRQALHNLGITPKNYFASEIDKKAIEVSKSNWDDITQLGDIKDWREWDLPKINLIIGGSPCQSFSYGGKGGNFEDPRGGLFFDYVDIKEHYRPKHWFLENVKMKQEWQDTISFHIGVSPVLIDSALVSAQSRKRLYWGSNVITVPIDQNINISDIVGPGLVCGRMVGRKIDPDTGKRADHRKDLKSVQHIECKSNAKSHTLTTVDKDNVVVEPFTGRMKASDVDYRYLTVSEYEALQTLPEGYTREVSDTAAKKLIGNGWTVKTIEHVLTDLFNK